ncbi:MAG: hypothetical protein J5771_00655 [Bacteroidales bacterium]|nr:hypothetical protein [Bacteroidales bacterium]
MKFKTITILLLAAMAALSCGEKKLTPDPGSTGPLPGKISMSGSTVEFNFERTGGSGSVSFMANRAWKAKSSDAWLTATPTSGSKGAENTVTFTATANPNYQDAKATLSITCGNAVKTLTIIQAGYGLPAQQPKLLLAGDSICTEYAESAAPQTGWGQCIGAALGDGVQVVNLAVGGESTKSFIDEGKWEELLAQVDTGDIVIINFGHNDEKTDAAHGTTTSVYSANLKKFASEVRTKGGSPVLVTPMSRRNFSDAGVLARSHGDYPNAMRTAGGDTRTPVIDLEEISFQWLGKLGEAASEDYYVVNKRVGVDNDNTHLVLEGAQLVAGWIADGLKNIGLWVY